MEKGLTIVITGAGGNIGYVLCFNLISDDVFGSDTKINLKLIEIPKFKTKLEGIKMELEVNFYL